MKAASSCETEDSPFYLIDDPLVRRKAVWNPWPVKLRSKDHKLSLAQDIIWRLNSTSFDRRFDPVIALPASSDGSTRQGGRDGFDLYSIRSPSTLPYKIILHTVRNSRLMVRNGCQSLSFESFLAAFKYRIWNSLPKDRVWKLLLADRRHLKQIGLSGPVQEELYRRWWLVDGFPFRELPSELRIIIIGMVLDEWPKLYDWWRYRKETKAFTPQTNLYLVNRQLMRETKSLMFMRTEFIFKHLKHFQLFTRGLTDRSLATIRSIRLALRHEVLLTLFCTETIGLILEPAHIGHEYSRDKSDPCQFYTKGFSMIHHLVSLHTFEIFFPRPFGSQHPALKDLCQRAYCWVVFSEAYKYLKGIPYVEFGGYIKKDQNACFLKLLAQGSEEAIEECETSCESEHFDRMGLNSIWQVH